MNADSVGSEGVEPIPTTALLQGAKRNGPATRVQIAWIEALLSDGREFIVCPVATVADFAVYHTLWFITDRTERLAFELRS
jgi:glutathione S-transferase